LNSETVVGNKFTLRKRNPCSVAGTNGQVVENTSRPPPEIIRVPTPF